MKKKIIKPLVKFPLTRDRHDSLGSSGKLTSCLNFE